MTALLVGINTVRELFKRGVKVQILNMGLVEDTPTGRLIFSVMSAFAEFERDMIVERTQEGKAIVKQKPDFREGRPKKYSKKQIEHALKLKEAMSYKQVEELTGIQEYANPCQEKTRRSLKHSSVIDGIWYVCRCG
ncbi:hypothetical protein GCM10028868_24160 [Virgibacillus kimchii]